jgi:hypothetical protein
MSFQPRPLQLTIQLSFYTSTLQSELPKVSLLKVRKHLFIVSAVRSSNFIVPLDEMTSSEILLHFLHDCFNVDVSSPNVTSITSNETGWSTLNALIPTLGG